MRLAMTIAIEPDHLLSPLVTAHCFWGRCRHVVTDTPIAAHDAMERHYAEAHDRDMDRLLEHRRRPR